MGGRAVEGTGLESRSFYRLIMPTAAMNTAGYLEISPIRQYFRGFQGIARVSVHPSPSNPVPPSWVANGWHPAHDHEHDPGDRDGVYQPSKERMADPEAEKGDAPGAPGGAGAAQGRLHPTLARLYRAKVAALEQALADPAIKAEAAEIIRSQIERITPTPNEWGTPEVQPHGDLALILELSEADERKCERPGHERPGGELSVVAGACNTLCLLLFATRRIGRTSA
jgi:hypothetical protein